jgi:hypothetical protein
MFATAFVAGFALTGCGNDGSRRPGTYYDRPAVQVQTAVIIQDDYDYYPGYEVYYSRSRREYVYRDGNAWVRRPQPPGVRLDVLLASPSVRMDFRDSPEQHHNTVIRSYPRNWQRPEMNPKAKDDHRNDKKDDRKDSDRKH